MSFRNVVDFADSHDNKIVFVAPAPLPDPVTPLPDIAAVSVATADIRKRDLEFNDLSYLDHRYWTTLRHNVYAYSNPGVDGYFGPTLHPRDDIEIVANTAHQPKIDELEVRIEYQAKRRRVLEQLDGHYNAQINQLIEAKRANLREMINSRLEQTYHMISLEVIDVDVSPSEM